MQRPTGGPTPSGPPSEPPWLGAAAEVLGAPAGVVRDRAKTTSFVELGGSSLGAVRLAGLVERHLRRRVELAALLGPEPLGAILAAAGPVDPAGAVDADAPAADPRAVLRPTSAGQQAMLLGTSIHGGRAFHLLFGAEVGGRLELDRLRAALRLLTRRHQALRTVFVESDGRPWMRVLPSWEPRLLRLSVPTRAGGSGGPADSAGAAGAAVTEVHSLLAAASERLLRPLEQPPVVFGLARTGPESSVLALLGHHALLDGWSVGLLWRELVAAYDGRLDPGPVPGPGVFVAAQESAAARAALDHRAAALRGAPVRVEIPTDLPRPDVAEGRGARLHFLLAEEDRADCESLAAACGVTRNTVLLAAWAVVVGRRAGMRELLIGVPVAGRADDRSHGTVGFGSVLVPVRCRLADRVREHLTGVAAALRDALEAAHVPVEHLGGALGAGGDPRRQPLVQIGFAAHDELVPARLHGRDLVLDLHEGHCGGTVFDALLYVQRWGNQPRLALEYAPSVLGPDDAAALAGELGAVLRGMAAAGPGGRLRDVAGMTAEQAERLADDGRGAAADAEAGLWQLVDAVCDRFPDAVAVRDAERGDEVCYGRLREAAEHQCAALRAAGVRPGDRVALAVDRSVAEIVAVLGVLRAGAAYVGVQADMPAAVAGEILRIARPRAVLGDPERAAELAAAAPGPVAVVPPVAPAGRAEPAGPEDRAERAERAEPEDRAERAEPAEPEDRAEPAEPAEPGAVAYVAFTSGSTGIPKGVRVPHRAVVRLARDPDFLRPGALARFLRLAPLAFDASTLEIFAPLLAGGTIEVHPLRPVAPAELADFLRDREVTGLWLTAGLFRLVADERPAAFRPVRQLLTGGDVVPPDQVSRVLEACPGLRVTNGYGPTENTTFTTVHHVDDPAAVEDPLPIGRPVAGTDVVVTGEDGALLPPGAVGELCALGTGLAIDYLDAPEETEQSFLGSGPARRYRTGDLVRWDGAGRLRYLGRRDQQVKIRGFRVELAAVTAVLREHAAVRDAVVAVTPDPADRRVVAAVVAEPVPGLVPSLRGHAAQRLPPYAVPALWAVVDALPLTGNGKVDAARLVELAGTGSGPPRDAAAPSPRPAAPAAPVAGSAPAADGPAADLTNTELEEVIAAVWAAVLGTDDFGYQDRFFDVGGNSLQLDRVRGGLLARLPGSDVSVLDLLRYPTVEALAGRLRAGAR